jgi:hypothetical protein
LAKYPETNYGKKLKLFPPLKSNIYIYIYMHMYIIIHTHTHTHIYIYKKLKIRLAKWVKILIIWLEKINKFNLHTKPVFINYTHISWLTFSLLVFFYDLYTVISILHVHMLSRSSLMFCTPRSLLRDWRLSFMILFKYIV